MTSSTAKRDAVQCWAREKLFLDRSAKQYFLPPYTGFTIYVWIVLIVGIPITVHRFLIGGLESTTNLDDNFPWGLWIGFDVLVGVALAAGGFVLGSTVHLFGMKQYYPLVRPAILTGFLGYFFVVVGLSFDLGRPWRLPYPMGVGALVTGTNSFGVTSVMFLVGWHVATYLTVQLLEFCPAIFEWLDWKTLRKWAIRITIGATVFGVILSTLHQSALGALFLIAKGKVHPLWYSPFIPIFFLTSAVIGGITMVIFESMLSHRLFHTQVKDQDPAENDRLVIGLGKAASVLLFTYFCMKWIGVAHGQVWHELGTKYGAWFMVEVFGFVLLPCFLFAVAVRNQNATLTRAAAVLTVLGIVLNRLNVSLITFQWNLPDRYFPKWTEFAVTIMVVTLGLATFRFMVNRMPVLYDHPDYEPEH